MLVAVTAEMTGGVVSFATVTVTPPTLCVAAASRRRLSGCGCLSCRRRIPGNRIGRQESSTPIGAPSSWNWTPTTRRLSLAVALTATLLETVEPLAGAVIDTKSDVVQDIQG